MNILGWVSKVTPVDSMTVGCKFSESSVPCPVTEVSGRGMTCTVPWSRIRECLMDRLGEKVAISVDNRILEGVLAWYTIEESAYRIGITIERKHRAAWRSVLAGRAHNAVHPSARTASV